MRRQSATVAPTSESMRSARSRCFVWRPRAAGGNACAARCQNAVLSMVDPFRAEARGKAPGKPGDCRAGKAQEARHLLIARAVRGEFDLAQPRRPEVHHVLVPYSVARSR